MEGLSRDKGFEEVITYHERTKHLPHRYARSSGYLDWANEPDPFRTYDHTESVPLSLTENDPLLNYHSLYDRSGTPFQVFSLKHIAAFLELSLGLSAWKSFRGNSWALRMNPSSGNLHPTEAYLILPPLDNHERQGSVCHYDPLTHSLEKRAAVPDSLWINIQNHFRQEGFFVALSSIHWRESWKYGERAFRYCNLDMGHAIACLSFSAGLMGWKTTLLSTLSDHECETLLGFTKTEWREHEREYPGPLLFVHGASTSTVPRDIPSDIILSFDSLPFSGTPKHLSSEHVVWSIIDEVSRSTAKAGTPEQIYRYGSHGFLTGEPSPWGGSEIIRRRRSAQAYDGKTGIEKDHFLAILDRTIPRSNSAPFDTELGDASIHLFLFVHRVSGLEPGIYFLIRNERDSETLKERFHTHFVWERVKGTPPELPLFLLQRGDFISDAASMSCFQDIAGDGAFSLGMIARFRASVEEHPFMYRHLFWEAGMIGQVLYLEAEALSMRGTGIGCFFDDLVHRLLGIRDHSFQDLYHFTIGNPLEDTRLETVPPYHHLKR